MHKVFISYHHENDQDRKEELVKIGEDNKIFINESVDTGDISDELSDEDIREKIRDECLRESTVTIVLVGEETKNRKHVDWEIYSSMFDGKINKKSGILVVNLPSVDSGQKRCHTAHSGEEEKVYPEIDNWTSVSSWSRAEYERRFPHMPDRIIDNLLKSEARLSVTYWDKILEPKSLRILVEATFQDRDRCEYDLSRPMKRKNS